MKQRGFFDEEDRLKEISRLGDPLERLNATIEWERFRPYLNRALKREAKGPGGRPPFDYVLMFKILILQRLYGISDAQTEYQIKDRLSFMRFLGLSLSDSIPDEKTIWHFREQLVQAGSIDRLFERFNQWLEEAGLITRTGSIVDATFVDVPRQRNSKDENEAIKNGTIPEEWKTKENRHKMAQKDVDARWTKKHDETHYGYKNHIKADKDSKLIVRYAVTSAERKKRWNTKKSKIRARIEHIFGFMTTSMKGMMIRCIGRARAAFTIGLMNLVYNMCRYEFLVRARSQGAVCLRPVQGGGDPRNGGIRSEKSILYAK